MVLVVALFGAACDESVNPVLQTGRPFTMYGFLNPKADTQAVRVFTIDGVLQRTSTAPLDARVISTDLTDGTEVVWRDSVIEFGSGMNGHVYWSLWKPVLDRRYRLTVQRSDGATSEALTIVPPLAVPEVIDPNPVFFELPMPVLWRHAPNLIDIQVTYLTSAGRVTIDYEVDQQDATNGRVVVVQFRRDTRELLLDALINGIDKMILFAIEMRVVVTNAEWTPPGDVFDPNVLVQPGTFSNVENGFGFWGAGYPDTVRWRPPDEILLLAGFDLD